MSIIASFQETLALLTGRKLLSLRLGSLSLLDKALLKRSHLLKSTALHVGPHPQFPCPTLIY
jgi:hypothetical protein